MMPTLVIADRENNPDSRLPAVLLRINTDDFGVWVWVSGLRRLEERKELHLFNLTPPGTNREADLGQVRWDWYCGGLVFLKLIPAAFAIHFSEARSSPVQSAPKPGETLWSALVSIPLSCEDESVAVAIADSACNQGSPSGSTTLEEFLKNIIVPDNRQDSGPTTSRSLDDKLKAIRRVSIWTPGANEYDFVQFYGSVLGEPEARRLWNLSRASIDAVAKGDFQKQVSLGTELASVVPDNSILAGEAAYFKGEGLRLLADIEPTSAKKDEFRAEAIAEYAHASALLGKDPRPVRGLGRIAELRGDLDGALKYFKIAKGLCLTESAGDSVMSPFDLAHEILRTTRHFVHCLLDIRATNPASEWHRVHKENELQGYLQECENLHVEHMPRFQSDPEWYYIEWFMGFVFLAKAWGALGKFHKMQTMLAQALDARRRILGASMALTVVERANLDWWLAVAKSGSQGFDSDFAKLVDRFAASVAANELATLASRIEDIVRFAVPPWTLAQKGGQ